MNQNEKHSPLPWCVDSVARDWVHCPDDGRPLAMCDIFPRRTELNEANAAFIVKSVNEAPLLEAVAEAAGLMVLRMNSEISRFPASEKIKRQRFIDRMESSLSALSTYRKGGAK